MKELEPTKFGSVMANCSMSQIIQTYCHPIMPYYPSFIQNLFAVRSRATFSIWVLYVCKRGVRRCTTPVGVARCTSLIIQNQFAAAYCAAYSFIYIDFEARVRWCDRVLRIIRKQVVWPAIAVMDELVKGTWWKGHVYTHMRNAGSKNSYIGLWTRRWKIQ